MANGIITELFDKVDSYGDTFVVGGFTKLRDVLTGTNGGANFAAMLFTVYIIFWGVQLFFGTARGSFTDAIYRLFRVACIYFLATNVTFFFTYFYQFFNALSVGIGNAMLVTAATGPGGGGTSINDIDGVKTALDNLFNSGMQTASAFIEGANVLNPGGWFMGLAVIIVMVLFVMFAAFLIIMSKVFIWLMMALAPVFIVMLLFTGTNAYFMGWLKVIIHWVVVQILAYAMIAFFLSISQSVYAAIDATNADWQTKIAEISTFLLITAIGVVVLSQIQIMASAISGAIGFYSPTIQRFWAKPTRLGGDAAVGTGRMTWRRMRGESERLSEMAPTLAARRVNPKPAAASSSPDQSLSRYRASKA